jgi:hypothetical protein
MTIESWDYIPWKAIAAYEKIIEEEDYNIFKALIAAANARGINTEPLAPLSLNEAFSTLDKYNI